MKFNPFYLLLFVLLAFSSCKKDDEFSEDDLIGNWKLSGIACNDGKVTIDFFGSPLTGAFKLSGRDFDADLTFSKALGLKSYISSGTFINIATYTLGGTEEIVEEETTFDDSGSWSLSGKTLTISSLFATSYTGEIIKLDDNNLEYKATIEENDPEYGKTTGTFVFTFKK